ncbi:CHRD domain-containing protein [Halobacillus karajensis]|uniref:CHRD domain protein n=1 Tax=Halobacillus karajensis TaxID=195088 RepID=A0A024P887_9BACI|nr:CHRD domain-containing protein [Halobacillus karajensis]CDQ18210.1 CHRD domain protein [Halobacillus karajensis]CDQ24562.1 CHRD domain protein [Halobacillus karajensis]CDQ29191.1 CHRD domain protein [Halobacillus karajensis]SEH57151.1 CHRD domain-containing protein [Halobacillus karajensis]
MERFIAKLKGKNEIPPVNTDAFGVAKFIPNKNCTKIKFQLEVEDIRNFVQAHIHFGARDENGPVIAFLFGANLMTLEEQEGITTRRGKIIGAITDKDIEANDVGIDDVGDLLKFMRKELTYVNAHTEQNPGGEIRGQIIPLDKR